MPERKYLAESSYRYGFNGKENDNEIKGEGNQQDYGMRVYDPRLGKFLSVDPFTKEYPWYSPFQFAGNTPIWAIDLDGKEPLKYTDWQFSGWTTYENFKKIKGSTSHVKVTNFGDIHNDGHNYIAIRDQKIPGKWHYAVYDEQVGSLGNVQKGNWQLYNPELLKYEPWKPEGWISDDIEIMRRARHVGVFGEFIEEATVQLTIFGVTAPLGGVGSWGSRFFLNSTIEIGVNGKNADVADIVTNSLPGSGGLVGVGTGAFLDWSPASSNPQQRKFSSPLFPNTSVTNNKSFMATGVDIITGASYEGFKFLPQKTIQKLTPRQTTIIDVSGSIQEKIINKVMKDGTESNKPNP